MNPFEARSKLVPHLIRRRLLGNEHGAGVNLNLGVVKGLQEGGPQSFDINFDARPTYLPRQPYLGRSVRAVPVIERVRLHACRNLCGALGYPSNEAEPLTQNVNGSLASETTKSSDGEPTRFRLDITSEPKLLEERLPTKLLKLYYPDSDLRAQNLFRYSYSVNGDEITTNIVTSTSWLELAIPLNERAFRSFPLREPIVSWPLISESDSDRLKAELREKGIQFHNKPIYCLQSFTPRDRKTIASFSMAQYIDYKLKLGLLEEELTQALISSDFVPRTAYAKRRSQMPLRNELLPDSKTMANYGRRLCAGGTNVLLVFRKSDQEDFIFLVKRRSKNVSTGRRLFSLLPSGMHQPTTRANAEEETSIAATVYRETYEELFGGKEVEADDKHIAAHWYMSKPQLAWFKENPKSFTLEVVSFGLNLIDGTYEFGVLLVIHDDQYWEKYSGTMTLNEEVDDSKTPHYSTLDSVRLASLMTDHRCADASLIVLLEGLRRLSQLEPARVNLPRIEIIT